MESSLIELSRYRFERAKEDLNTAKSNLQNGHYKASINRSYYAVFHGLRAVNALYQFDSRKHSGVIAFFNKEIVKSGLIDKEASSIIATTYRLREKADYDDFYVASSEQANKQYESAVKFLALIQPFLEVQWNNSDLLKYIR